MPYQSEPESLPAIRYDPIAERLLRARTIVISGEITQGLAATVAGQLLALEVDSERIEKDTHRNFRLGAEAVVRYGLVGRIVERSLDIDA